MDSKQIVSTCDWLSKLKSSRFISIDLDLTELDITKAEKKASYDEIRTYIFEHYGMNVSNLYVAQVKHKFGIIERANYNKPKSATPKVPKCPTEKEIAITETLRHFMMI